MVKLGMLGFGTVGQGVADILERRREDIALIVGESVELKKVLVRDLSKDRKISLPENTLTIDSNEVILDEEISVIIEVTGDLEDSYKYIKKALLNGKHVVTANKAVVSAYFEELSHLAEQKGLYFLYEASAGGGIPFIKPLKDAIRLNNLKSIKGILNGTCNYMLTKMTHEGMDYNEVLKEAQDLGYAEADPSADVDGIDTMRKLRIIGTLALGASIAEDDIICDGISKLSAFDIKILKNHGYVVKLVGEAKEVEDGYTAIVQPVAIPIGNGFAGVNGALNTVSFAGDNVGDLSFTGAGAGMLPTANAVLSDVMDCILDSQSIESPLRSKSLKNKNDSLKGNYYVRFTGDYDSDSISGLFIKNELSDSEPFAVITEEIGLNDLLDLIAGFGIDDYCVAKIGE
ncbi:MAG: homoserine dehydrogenase [Gudongella sp.]|jgi:homoserine dehydrogenase|nr:homoserine dehydrogenase [Gudongella sp.]